MADLTLREKKQLLLDAITTVDQITEEVKDMYPGDEDRMTRGVNGEPWDAENYKSFLIRKLGTIEYELQNTEEETTTNTTEETNTEQVTQQETNNNEEENKDEKEEEEEEKP